MSSRLLRTAVELSRPSAPTYLPVKVERRRRRQTKVVFAVALAVTVLSKIVSGDVEIEAPPPRDVCFGWGIGYSSDCPDPLALADAGATP